MAITAALFAGCGGGGDGDEEPVTPTSESTVPLAITESNYFTAMQVPTFYAEALLTLANDVMRWTETLATTATATAALQCGGGGSIAARWSDTNSDGKVRPGDGMTLDLTNCDAPASATRFSGTMQLTIGNPTVEGAVAVRIDLLDGLRFGAGDVTGVWRGALNAERIVTARTDDIWAHAADSDRLRVELRSGNVAVVDRVEALDVVRGASLDWYGATTWLDMTLASDVLRGKVALKTIQPIGASFDTYPVRGVLEVSGAGRVQLRGASGQRTA